MTRLAFVLTALITAAIVAPAARMPVRATFTADLFEHTWALAELDPQLVAAAKTTHARLLDVHRGSARPFDRPPRAR